MEEKCSFCGKSIADVEKLVKSPAKRNTFICDACARIIFQLTGDGNDRKSEERKRKELPKAALGVGAVKGGPVETPADIHRYLDRYIIGQERAKKALSVAVYNHGKRLRDKRIRKSNILLIGPSGCGKTLLAKKMAETLSVPFASADATAMTEAGYVGEDADACLRRLLAAAGGDVGLAQKGIVFIDEIDKIACKEPGKRDIGDGSVQAALLKLIEAREVSVPAGGERARPNEKHVTMDTANILFIFGGAFSGLADRVGNEGRRIGFSAGGRREGAVKADSVGVEDLVRYGMMPELVGRIPVICQLDDLNEDELTLILTEPEDAITKEYAALLKKDGVKLVFEPDALAEIAKTAIERKTGARGLRSVMEDIMLDVMYEIPSRPDIGRCVITSDSVRTKRPTLIKKRIREKSKDMADASI